MHAIAGTREDSSHPEQKQHWYVHEQQVYIASDQVCDIFCMLSIFSHMHRLLEVFLFFFF